MSVGLVVNPLMYGLVDIASMLALSAPSAKILTRRLLNMSVGFQNEAGGFRQRSYSKIVIGRSLLVVSIVNEKCGTSGSPAGFHIGPSISNHIPGGQINRKVFRRAQH